MYTDRCFHVSFDWLVQRQADNVDTYTYEFDYRGSWGLTDSYKNIGLNVSSADDCKYIELKNNLNIN